MGGGSCRGPWFGCVWPYRASPTLHFQAGGETRRQQSHCDVLCCDTHSLCLGSGTAPAWPLRGVATLFIKQGVIRPWGPLGI